MLVILFAHAVATALAPLLVYRWGRMAFYPLALVPLGSLVWVALNWPGRGDARSLEVSWVPELSMNITLRFDALAAIMSVLVLGIGALVLFYCADYFHHHDGHTEKRLPSFAAELVAFAGAMFGLVVSDNMLVLYVFWELTTVLSFLLVGHYAERATSRRAAMQALLVTTAGGLAMLVGIVVLGTISGTYLLSELIATPPAGLAASVGIVLILVGALAKSAIVPLHFWLPGAMAAPTPVSAYLHAAAMVKAGVYLVARMTPGFADSPPWRPMVITLGVLTVLLAGWRAVREYDLKLILAFGTVSQLGLITVMVGAGGSDLMLAGLALLCAHAMFKAALFMVVGIIDHTTGTRDIRRLAWLGHASSRCCAIAVGATASMAALPPFLGFVAKEADYETLLHSESLGQAAPFVLAGIVARLGVHHHLQPAVPLGRLRAQGAGRTEQARRRDAPAACLVPRPASAPRRRRAALRAVAEPAGPRAGHLRRHGARGRGLRPGAVARPQAAPAAVGPGAGDRHRSVLRQGAAAADEARLRAAGQRRPHLRRGGPRRRRAVGSADRNHAARLDPCHPGGDPVHAGDGAGGGAGARRPRPARVRAVGLAVAGGGRAADPGRRGGRDGDAQPAGRGAAGRCDRLRLRRDLRVPRRTRPGADPVPGGDADTRRLRAGAARPCPPKPTARTSNRDRLPRVALAVAVGASVTTLAVFAMAARTGVPIAALLPDAAYYRGHGANTVNVLLVDIRAWDTLGEISVLLVAATGVASMVFRHRRFGAAPRVSDAGQPDIPPTAGIATSPAAGDITWLRGSELRDPRNRSLVLEVATRLIFPLIMVLSVYFFFAGHNTPGGGFAGGLTAGLALVLRYLAGGRYELGETLPLDAGKILGVGLALSAGTAVASLLLGAPVLSSAVLQFDIPVLGTVKLVTALFFDLGVYLIVVGLVLDVLRSLGARLDVDMAEQSRAVTAR